MFRPSPNIPSAMCQAALHYAKRGWPVFPCREVDQTIDAKGQPRTFKAKQPYTKNGLKDATTDPGQIKLWWVTWPNAMIGLPMGPLKRDCAPDYTGPGGCGLFALDFDPRVDEDGEIYTLERLKADVEEQIGCALPASLAVRTPSDGVHVYLKQPAGEPIRNRGNLPKHVDVRGLGGYVVAPPSVIYPGLASEARYRFLHGKWDAEVEEAPPALIEALRAPKAQKLTSTRPRPSPAGGALPADLGEAGRKAIKSYASAALEGELQAVRGAGSGQRNPQLNESALKIASLVAAGALDPGIARASLEMAARDNPGRDDDRQLIATIDSGWSAGMNNPRDLGEIAAAARERAGRRRSTGSRRAGAGDSRPRTPDQTVNGTPSSHPGGDLSEGAGRGSGGVDDAGDELLRRCAFFPQTDLGNLQRFLARFGDDFLYVEQWGWLAWDGQRWNRDLAVPLLGRAVQRTMRLIQDEAAFVAASGRKDEDTNPAGLDFTAKWKGQEPIAFSTVLAAWGRSSESSSHIGCIPKMAEARCAVRPADFDPDPLKLNVANGTLLFERPDGDTPARVTLRPHERSDRMTKIAEVAYDAAATSARYDAFLAEVQPEAEMRDFLDVWAGYNALGLADAQKMAVFYGVGSNGKGVWINTQAHILGDYAWAAAIETFIDQGRYRKGSDASPDLAALAGRRMVYANEPEEGSKFSDGLIKAMTSDEPIGGVRELNRSPFELLVTFTNTISANNQPRIGTDHGIQRRMQLVPWNVVIPDDRADPQLKNKLKAEASGILNRMVKGALAYLTSGLPKPQAVVEATRDYLEANDLLGQFLTLAVAKVPGEVVEAGVLHRVFAGWQTWAQLLGANGKPWSPKYLNQQMQKKGFVIRKSSTMRWQDLALRYDEADFVDHEGKAKSGELPAPRAYGSSASGPAADAPDHPPPEDDGSPFVPGF